MQKRVDREGRSCYNNQRCRENSGSSDATILENDTVNGWKLAGFQVAQATDLSELRNSRGSPRVNQEKKQSDSERVNAWFAEEGEALWRVRLRGQRSKRRIEHKSLILAQDERWRRA